MAVLKPLDPYKKAKNMIKYIQEEAISMTNAEAWDYAIGMIKVDGLEPTADFR